MGNNPNPTELLGGLTTAGDGPLPASTWLVASAIGDGQAWSIPAGTLTRDCWLVSDFLLDGDELVVFQLKLQDTAGQTFELTFGLLPQCQARLQFHLAFTDQNRWSLAREGACLKRMCRGDRVVPEQVVRLALVVLRKSETPARFCHTPLTVIVGEPFRLTAPLLPHGPLLDDLGQSAQRRWPGKSRSQLQVAARLVRQREAAGEQRWPEGWSAWGGETSQQLEATGFFRVARSEQRWWLVAPDGHPFWSAGCDCVEPRAESSVRGLETALTWLPEPGSDARADNSRWPGAVMVNYLVANLERTFEGEWQQAWETIALSLLRQFGFNTVGNWSRWTAASAARFPYVRPLTYTADRAPCVFRDFPDVYHPDFPADAGTFAQQLTETLGDPAMIGYFLMNEPTWGFAKQTPALGMLYNTPQCHTRRALAEFLAERYDDQAALAAAWGDGVTFEAIAAGEWTRALTPAAVADLEAFSTVMVTRYFLVLSDACKAVDPDHLNLGVRYASPPPVWCRAGMRCFDIFSLNCYRDRLPAEDLRRLSEDVGAPLLVGEWHFGALDAGLPASGIGRVATQADRGKAYRVYLEHAAAQPWCVGVHWFTLYDQSALGRFDGETYNIGFVDVCHRPYEKLCAAARAAHEAVYGIARGEVAPFDDAPEYLPRLF